MYDNIRKQVRVGAHKYKLSYEDSLNQNPAHQPVIREKALDAFALGEDFFIRRWLEESEF